jgi:hypothetical protein
MAKVNAGIFTFFMDNINIKTVNLHAQVVKKFNPLGYVHHPIKTDMNHGASMDMVWTMNGQKVATFAGATVEKKFDFDVIMFLDVDCLPLTMDALEYYINAAAAGKLIGNIQRSNHIQNDQHVFAAPNGVAMSVDTFLSIGSPSAIPTARGDVGEEYTFAAEKTGLAPIELLMPLSFDEAPAECPSWALKDGMPHYGRGTTFGLPDRPLTWHQFQSFHPGQQEKYWKKCEERLALTV